ncbi:hypothetical protein J2785_003828 [Burkholderia ambifaria]|nr:hypothetical protein [Burkholderia ambifaria]MDR6500658.1 hypothetical protein [Burkholderia ambifaria]
MLNQGDTGFGGVWRGGVSTTSSVAPSGDGATYACGRCDENNALAQAPA